MTAKAVAIRPMVVADIASLQKVASHIWHQHYPSIISRAQIDHMLGQWYNAEVIAQQLASGVDYLLAVREREIVGYFSAEQLQGHHFIHKFYVSPEMQGQGIGKQLLNHWLMKTPQAECLRLRTHRKNHHTIAFYQRQGFEIIAEDDKSVGGGFVIEDYILQRKL